MIMEFKEDEDKLVVKLPLYERWPFAITVNGCPPTSVPASCVCNLSRNPGRSVIVCVSQSYDLMSDASSSVLPLESSIESDDTGSLTSGAEKAQKRGRCTCSVVSASMWAGVHHSDRLRIGFSHNPSRE